MRDRNNGLNIFNFKHTNAGTKAIFEKINESRVKEIAFTDCKIAVMEPNVTTFELYRNCPHINEEVTLSLCTASGQ